MSIRSPWIAYGLERIAMYIQEVDNVYDLEWTDGVTYGDISHQNEYEQSIYRLRAL